MCRDFKSGQCKRPQCKYVHLVEGKLNFLNFFALFVGVLTNRNSSFRRATDRQCENSGLVGLILFLRKTTKRMNALIRCSVRSSEFDQSDSAKSFSI